MLADGIRIFFRKSRTSRIYLFVGYKHKSARSFIHASTRWGKGALNQNSAHKSFLSQELFLLFSFHVPLGGKSSSIGSLTHQRSAPNTDVVFHRYHFTVFYVRMLAYSQVRGPS